MTEENVLFLVRIWPQRPGFKATVRLARDEHAHQFDEPAELARHLSELARALTATPAAGDDRCPPPDDPPRELQP